MSDPKTITIQQRTDILDKEIAKYTKKGYRLAARSETSAGMVRPKKFSFLWAFLWLLLFGIGLIVYLIWYWSRKDEHLFIRVEESGKVRITKK